MTWVWNLFKNLCSSHSVFVCLFFLFSSSSPSAWRRYIECFISFPEVWLQVSWSIPLRKFVLSHFWLRARLIQYNQLATPWSRKVLPEMVWVQDECLSHFWALTHKLEGRRSQKLIIGIFSEVNFPLKVSSENVCLGTRVLQNDRNNSPVQCYYMPGSLF